MVWTCGMLQWWLRQPLMESVGLGGPRWHGNSWQRGIAEGGSSRLSTLMIDTPGDLVWDLPCVQQASYLEGGPLMWMLPLYLHIKQKSYYDYDDMSCESSQNSLTLSSPSFWSGLHHLWIWPEPLFQIEASVKNQNRMANSVDPDVMAHYEPSHQDLHCLQKLMTVRCFYLQGWKS